MLPPACRLATRMAALASLQPYVRQVLDEPYGVVSATPYAVLSNDASNIWLDVDAFGCVGPQDMEAACEVSSRMVCRGNRARVRARVRRQGRRHDRQLPASGSATGAEAAACFGAL